MFLIHLNWAFYWNVPKLIPGKKITPSSNRNLFGTCSKTQSSIGQLLRPQSSPHWFIHWDMGVSGPKKFLPHRTVFKRAKRGLFLCMFLLIFFTISSPEIVRLHRWRGFPFTVERTPRQYGHPGAHHLVSALRNGHTSPARELLSPVKTANGHILKSLETVESLIISPC